MGFLGGVLGNIVTGLLDTRKVSIGSLIFTSLLSGIANMFFTMAVPDFAFGIKAESIWYNGAIMGFILYSGAIGAFRNLLLALVTGKF